MNCSRRVSNAVAGTKTVQQALSDAAEKNERTLERAGYEIKRGEKTPEVPDQDNLAGRRGQRRSRSNNAHPP